MSGFETKGAPMGARDWAQALALYRRADAGARNFELAVTFPPFAALWATMLFASLHGLAWLSFALTPLAAGLAGSPVHDPARLRTRSVLSEQAGQ